MTATQEMLDQPTTIKRTAWTNQIKNNNSNISLGAREVYCHNIGITSAKAFC